jgi:hypothetical protein
LALFFRHSSSLSSCVPLFIHPTTLMRRSGGVAVVPP